MRIFLFSSPRMMYTMLFMPQHRIETRFALVNFPGVLGKSKVY